MSELTNVAVSVRTGTGKGVNRRLRSQGIVPGVFYTKQENIPVQIGEVQLAKLYNKVGMSHVFTLKINKDDGDMENPTLIRDIHFDPVKPKILHVDFLGVDLNKEIYVEVPVRLLGEPKGAKEGGVLQLIRDTLEVYCLPMAVPDSIEIDVNDLGINDSVHIEDIKFPEGVTSYFDENYTIVTVTAPAAEEEAVEEEEIEGIAEGEQAEGEEGGEQAEGAEGE